MLRNSLIAVAIVLILALTLAVFSVAAEEALAGVTVINQSNQPATLSLTSGTAIYYLAVPAGETRYFTVERLVYDHTTFVCGTSASGTVDLNNFTRLVITNCEGAANAGEPSQEKIHLDDTPDGANWYYQY
ncbi:MAG TPA: hypothetical protein VI776_06410 [Anaerolineales bacterium]|nr:hypothetical protein [Anaerolineales bacterium]